MTLEQLRHELDNWEYVNSVMDNEGIEYCFRSYSDFKDIQNEEFHLKRKQLIDMMVDMEEFIAKRIEEVEDKIIDYPED